MSPAQRQAFTEQFFQSYLRRRPDAQKRLEEKMKPAAPAKLPKGTLESLELEAPLPFLDRQAALETIVSEERPVLFVKKNALDVNEATIIGEEAQDLVNKMAGARGKVEPLLPLVGRIDVANFPNNLPYVGTGWFVANDVVVTNRHVAGLIARNDGLKYQFKLGMDMLPMAVTWNNAHEYDDLPPAPGEPDPVFQVTEVLYIEPDSGPNDIAFIRVNRNPSGNTPTFIPVATTDVGPDVPVCVIGYPARASRTVIPDQTLMRRLYLERFDIKRAAPGYTFGTANGTSTHDCTTLGGNSGSVVVELATGRAVGLHFSGLYKEANFAVPASAISQYVTGQKWNAPVVITPSKPGEKEQEEQPQGTQQLHSPAAAAPSAATGSQTVSLTVPLNIAVTVSLGQVQGQPPTVTAVAASATPATTPPPVTAESVEQAALAYWRSRRPAGVLGARVGFLDDGDTIGDQPCIAVSVQPDLWQQFTATAPATFQGVPVRYFPADAGEQIDALPVVEAVTSIAYDDDARTGDDFSFDQVEEEMDVLLHVGPEYSWDALHDFLGGATVPAIAARLEQGLPMDDTPAVDKGSLVSAMYEFHGTHIKDAIEARLDAGASLRMVLDNTSFAKPKDDDFDRVAVFADWEQRFKARFSLVVAPEGLAGLIANAYHIKVTVRNDNTFWLSSGNWKSGSSQPPITAEQLAAAAAGDADLPGNREWHVVIKSPTLAGRFRSHIEQDFKRSQALGGTHLPKKLADALNETFVDVPVEESIVLERRAPSTVVKPLHLSGKVKVRPLLTPDREGAVFSKAVLKLINSAKKSLLFQIPYIGMPSKPGENRGFIDDLIGALTEKLTSLEDARLILRTGGSKLSSPTHAAWYFKSKGVDIDSQLRVIDDHHTKGMIVDGKRVLVGSHNWSAPGVTLNRDASLIFDNADAAGFYTQAFEIDWARANKLTPRKFVPKPANESTVLEAVGDTPPAGYVRMPLSEWLKEE